MIAPDFDLRAMTDRVSNWVGGAYGSYMLRHHLRYVAMTFVTIVSAITAFNVSIEIGQVWAEASVFDFSTAVSRTLLYLFCRFLDNSSQVFCIAVLLGLVWAETSHALGGRLLMVRVIGLNFLQRSMPLIILATLCIPIQFVFDNIIRPYAYMTLSREGLGEFGWKYARERGANEQWFTFGATAIRMVVRDIPRPTIEHALISRFDETGTLVAITTANQILPPVDGQGAWIMQGARSWRIGDPESLDFGKPVLGEGIHDEALDTRISELWLTYRWIEPRFVPLIDLLRLIGDQGLPTDAPDYSAWLTIRMMQPVLTGLVALFVGASFAILLEFHGLPIAAAGGVVAAYGCHFYGRISSLIIENTPASPPLTAILLLVLLALPLVAMFYTLRRTERLAV